MPTRRSPALAVVPSTGRFHRRCPDFRRVPWENADMRVMVIVYGLALSPTPPDAI